MKLDNFVNFSIVGGFFIGLILSLLKFDRAEYILFGTLVSTVGFYLIILLFASVYMGFVYPRKRFLNKAELERKLTHFSKEFVQREKEMEDLLDYVRNYEYEYNEG
ncbi:hypothetical protein [Helicobacter heilmannii]|uniref:Motility integral membrane protein n=1 Tax=Helicobacter heilmannii TaxID=35817 RepID=A0A0K2XVJ8_HELHE|nr:hypothetical protein [Helicobacter heilmannii]CCM11295.1 Motility integral membrane protein [Helicobacter heilmannii ASB1.4]CRF45283.1 Motility integral membrane protein [Helicobacter heilmannii]CRF47115.1 Motility integral membrane protein [Helicobacter heilmannii]CRF49591.1 Motility integral membrane protein [Helicobacter heilmannii]CRF50668.1 Motility integral membrane protein [Helicobacter heilmannii]